MTATTDLDLAYTQLLDLSGRMADAGEYEVAYHALMAALHCAESAGNAGRLAEVARVCRGYKLTVDALVPPHRLATRQSSHGRSVFEMGAATAEVTAQRLENRERLDELRRGGRLPGREA
jgi:hypothetical protein